MHSFDARSILVTGGTGSFGKAFVRYLLSNHPELERIVIFSRDELKQWEMSQLFTDQELNRLRFFLGDIRDLSRLKTAFEGIDIVVHAAALKQVPAAEYNPMEFIKTNVIGSENIVQASLESNVKIVVALSTDKAAAPINLYGATKLCSDKLFIAANNIRGCRNIKFSIVRYGNVVGSRGSVIPFFIKKAKSDGIIPITHPAMTRFSISLLDGIKIVISAIENSIGGEIYVPLIPSYRILDVAEAIAPGCQQIITGIRPGEKIHEEMITEADSPQTYYYKGQYIILPSDGNVKSSYDKRQIDLKLVSPGFSYNSETNDHFLNVDQIRHIIKKNIDPEFKPIQ